MAASVARCIARSSCKFVVSAQLPLQTCSKRFYSVSRCLSALYYTKKHEWISLDNGKGTVGISDFAQNQLGDVVYVELPEVGATLSAEDTVGVLESVKAASDVFSPVGGTVTEVNTQLQDTPELINKSPFKDGWMYKMDVEPNTKTDHLMDEDAYKKYLETCET